MTWKPIASCPREPYAPVLLLCPGGYAILSVWSPRHGGWSDEHGDLLHRDPTHWLPIPPPPEEAP